MAVMVLVIRNVHTWWVEYPDRHLQAFGGVSHIFNALIPCFTVYLDLKASL